MKNNKKMKKKRRNKLREKIIIIKHNQRSEKRDEDVEMHLQHERSNHEGIAILVFFYIIYINYLLIFLKKIQER